MRRNLPGIMLLLAIAPAFACTAKATVQRSTPVANLRVYRGVMVRGAANNMQRWQGKDLADRTARYIQQKCQFDAVFTGEPATQPTKNIDLIIDLSVLKSARGGGGIVSNPNVAVVEVAMALSDSTSDELLGSASIRGKSPAVVTESSPPEQLALDAVAKQVTSILVNSGCTGQRLARVVPVEPKPEPKPVDNKVTPEQVAQAETLSEAGKTAFREGDPATAKARFEEAIAANPDPRYIMNLCLAEEALEQYDEAIASCQRVVAAKPEPRLIEKAQARIELITELKSGG